MKLISKEIQKSPSEIDGQSLIFHTLMTNMANTFPTLPPEILRIVASYLDHDVVLTLGMMNRYCAGIFSDLYYNSWDVRCCKEAQKAIKTSRGPNIRYNSTNMDRFFRALKSGLAPAYAKTVHFSFCMHKEPVNHDDETCSKGKLQTNWPLDQTGEFLKLLNVSDIYVAIGYPRRQGYRYICNEQFLRCLLRESPGALPNAVINLRVGDRFDCGGSCYFTIRDSSTSQAAVADNIQRALDQIWPSSDAHDLWDELELNTFFETRHIRYIFPNVRCLRFSRWSEYTFVPLPPLREYVTKPEEWLTAFPQCQQLVCLWGTFDHYGRLGITFYFDDVSAQERQCTKILVHNEICDWILELHQYEVVSKHVKVIEFHQTQLEIYGGRWWSPYTPAKLNTLLVYLAQSFPNLERMILKFGAGVGMELITEANYPGALSEGFCERCQFSVNVLEFDIRTMCREGSLSAVDPLLVTELGALRLGSQSQTPPAEYWQRN